MRKATEFMKEYFKDYQKIIGLELGVCYGDHAKELLDELPKLYLHLVDNCSAVNLNQESLGREVNKNIYNGRIEWHKKESREAAKEIEDKSLDFVYIDAEHDYDNVKQDLHTWVLKVKDNGVLCGHDYSNIEGCKRAVDEFLGEVHHNDGCYDWWFAK